MKNLALARIQAMKPYSPPLSGRSHYEGLLLDFNERTQSSKSTLRALGQLVRDESLQQYPEYFNLTTKIAEYAGVDPSQVMITNGTDQGIDVILRTFADKDDAVIIPAPTFAMYRQYAQVAGNRIISPLYRQADLAFPLDEVLASLDESVKLVVVCNPNSPTGTLVSIAAIAQIAQKATNAIVYVDEAYFEFSQSTAVQLIEQYPNIVVTRTFSKAFGLAALRVAYVIARPEYITQMLKVRGPYDVNQAAYYAAEAALGDQPGMQRYATEVMTEAKPFVEQFLTRNSVQFYPSAGNFILLRPDSPDAVLEALERNGILVRPQDKPNIEGTLRLTIGTLEQMKHFTAIYQTTVLNQAQQPYAFLDRDGTLIFEPPDTYQIDSLEKLRILDGVIEGLKALTDLGYKLIMITNQNGLGTPAFPAEDFRAPQQALMDIFDDAGLTFERVFICPHLPADNCACRKPKTGLLDAFLRGHPVDMTRSFVCGDRRSDQGLAKNLGLKYVPMPTNGNFAAAIKPLLAKKPRQTKKLLVVIDYGLGNLASVANALEQLDIPFEISASPAVLQTAKALILPGVGAAGHGMRNLRERGLDTAIIRAAGQGTPILGICLGMQLLLSSSEEADEAADVECLGLVSGTVKKFETSLKVPHVGWNQVSPTTASRLMKGLPGGSYFYFVHSYYCSPTATEVVTGTTDYDTPFCSVLEQGNIFGVQFHPEKSGDAGMQLLRNFWEAGC